MADFTAIFDGSGSPSDTVALVVAGFVATTEQWLELEKNWKDCLEDFGVSALHMKDFAHHRGDFKGWKGEEQRRRRFLARLINIISTRVRQSFGSAVIMDDYRTVDAKYQLSEHSRPYSIAGCSCLTGVRNWALKWLKSADQIFLVFEDGDLDKGDLIRTAKTYFGATPGFLSKSRSVAFQAADLLAYEQFLANVKIHKSRRIIFDELRYPLRELSKIPGSDDWGVHDESDMTRGCIDDKIPLRT
jgi:hypothetical protein